MLTANAELPRSISLKIATPPPRTFSFKFPEAPVISSLGSKPQRAIFSASSRPVSLPIPSRDKTATRIKPPGDIIKL
ncbi:MAG TPA: hypothetical protein VKH44_07270, partial [Pirellulaceae bacterium]|nr:hypothetical protein [Pirellulaceae bacterium]